MHTPVLNKTPRLSSARMFVRLYRFYRLLLIHCIYVSVTKPTCPAFRTWLNTGPIRSLKVTGKAIMRYSMALPSKLCAALHGQSNVGSMCNCNPCRSLDLSVLVEILSELDSDHATEPSWGGGGSITSSRHIIEYELILPSLLVGHFVWFSLRLCVNSNTFITPLTLNSYLLNIE